MREGNSQPESPTMKTTTFLKFASLVSLSALAVGCSSLRTVKVTNDPSMAGASVAVDVVPVTQNTAAVEYCSVRDYWTPGNAIRQAAPHNTLRFGAGQPDVQMASKDWKSLGATKVAVLADLPGVFQDMPGDADPRRKLIPVGKNDTVSVRITPTGLMVETVK